MRALITGHLGQDGSYLAQRLLATGCEVHGLARAQGATPGVQHHVGDIRDRHFVHGLIADLAPNEIYNLAAISSVHQSWQEPDLTMEVNARGAEAVFDAAFRLHLQDHPVRVVQAGSAEIFGQPTQAPQHEATPLAPVNPYGVSKAYAHRSAQTYRGRGLGISNLILYNHESPRRPLAFVTRKITRGVAEMAAGRRDHLTLGNLTAIRDWGWAPDYVEAMVLAARASACDDYVIATGQGHSVRDFVAAACHAAGIADWQARIGTDPSLIRPADPVAQVGLPARAEAALGWRRSKEFPEIVAAMVAADLGQLLK